MSYNIKVEENQNKRKDILKDTFPFQMEHFSDTHKQ